MTEPLTGTIPVDAFHLRALLRRAREIGTVGNWVEVACEWADKAEVEYQKLAEQATALRAKLAESEKDTQRLDWLAYDGDDGPVFDALGDHDVHEAAGAEWDGEGDARPHYLRGFRAVIDAARQKEEV